MLRKISSLQKWQKLILLAVLVLMAIAGTTTLIIKYEANRDKSKNPKTGPGITEPLLNKAQYEAEVKKREAEPVPEIFTGEELMRKGLIAHRDGRKQEAIQYYKQAIEYFKAHPGDNSTIQQKRVEDNLKLLEGS